MRAAFSIMKTTSFLAGMENVVSGFAGMFADASLDCGMTEQAFEGAVEELVTMVRLNRAQMQRAAGQANAS